MAGIAGVLALIALAVSVVTYKQTADKTTSGRPAASAALNGVDRVDPDKFSQRLDGLARLITQNADHFASLQHKFASAIPARPTDAPAMNNLDDLMARLAALEAAGANQMAAPAVTDEPAAQGGFDTTHIGLLVAAGLLAENLAGRDIAIWASVLDDLRWPGVGVADRDIIEARHVRRWTRVLIFSALVSCNWHLWYKV